MSIEGLPGELMAAEVAEQPEALARLLDTQLPAIREIADRIRSADPRFVLMCARGTSDHAALYFKYLIEIHLGLPVGLTSPSTFTAYGTRPELKDVLWVSVSQSGGSPDLVHSTAAARAGGALTIAVTNAPESPLAAASEFNIDVVAGPEKAVAATKSYTSQLLGLYLLADAWRGGDASAARGLPDFAGAVVASNDGARAAARYRFVEKVVTTGRGYAYPTAREAALKLMETCYLSAHPFSSADLMHGPLAMIDETHPVIAFVPEGVGGAAIEPVLQRLRETNADLLIIGDKQRAQGAADVVALPPGIPEEVSPIIQIIPGQQLAHALSVSRGGDPDAPRGLRKVTETH
jgi:glucosamine--fructose-6-phosphate aminotransferase (isomerizing)